jgi:transposase
MPPEAKEILGLPDLNHDSTHYDKKIYLYGSLKQKPPCPRCKNPKVHIKSSFMRELRHFKIGNQLTVVRFMSHKFRCPACNCYFNLKLQGTLPKRRSTENFRLDVFERHQGGVTQKHLAQTHEISHATVERWYQGFIKERVSELSGRPVPQILGIDEHFFTRKKGYATTLVDLKNHKVFDVVLGRSEISLESYLRKLPNKHKVKVVVMDLSSTYRSIVKKHFPNAMIVADRFHVVRLINQHFLKAWSQFDPVGRKNRGLLSLMRRHEENLSPEQRVKLESYFLNYPHMKTIWEFKQKLHNLMRLKMLAKDTAWIKIHDLLPMIQELKFSPIEALKTLGETLSAWRNEIGRMWRFSKTNSITEGLHNKMEMISRRAFGFRNFENYRMRVLALCGWNGIINRKRKLNLIKT